jgi:hypothetical protein
MKEIKELVGILGFILAAAAVITLFSLAFAPRASAQLVKPFWEEQAPRYRVPDQRLKSHITCPEKLDRIPNGIKRPGKIVVVFLCGQYAAEYVDGQLVAHGRASTGMLGYETPPGRYVVCWHPPDAKNYRSKKYPRPNGGAPMPWATFICEEGQPSGGIAFHGGEIPRPHARSYGSSHGCVRVSKDLAWHIHQSSQYGSVTEVLIVRDVTEFHDEWNKSPSL